MCLPILGTLGTMSAVILDVSMFIISLHYLIIDIPITHIISVLLTNGFMFQFCNTTIQIFAWPCSKYIRNNRQKIKGYYNWISKYIEVHDTEYIKRVIYKQRASQRRKLNKIYKNINGHVVIVKAPVNGNRLAKYMLIRGSERRTGDYVSLAIYSKHLKSNLKNLCDNSSRFSINVSG